MTRFGRVYADDKLDRYYTPAWATRALLERIDVEGKTIAEPCAGQGHIVGVLEEYGADVRAYDIDPESPYHRDGWDATIPERYANLDADMVITNPPYTCDTATAVEVLSACLENFDRVCALVRQAFYAPVSGRLSILRDLSRVIVTPRVRFYRRDGSQFDTNPGYSCWLVWDSSDGPTEAEIVSKSERDRLKGQTDLVHDLSQDTVDEPTDSNPDDESAD